MNNKGQVNDIGIGTIMILFISVLVGVIFFVTIAQDVGGSTNTQILVNGTFATGVDESSIDITGQDLLSTPIVYNATGITMTATTDYIISEIVSESTGVKTISLQVKSADTASQNVDVSYTYGPDGYINDSGARSMATLIPLMFALAIAIIALTPTVRSELLNKMGR